MTRIATTVLLLLVAGGCSQAESDGDAQPPNPAGSASTEGASPTGLVLSRDRPNDVLLSPGDLTRAQKRSIDLRRVQIHAADHQLARIVLDIRQVLTSAQFDQIFLVTWTGRPDAKGRYWDGEVGFAADDNRDGYAAYTEADLVNGEWCEGVAVEVRPRQNRVIATVPTACTPTDPVRIELVAVTGTFRSDEPIYSRDSHAIIGYHDIGG